MACSLTSRPAIKDGIPKRVQKSKRLCDGDLPNKIVRQLFAEFMEKVNDQTPAGEPEATDLTVVKFWDDTYLSFIKDNLRTSTQQSYIQLWNRGIKT